MSVVRKKSPRAPSINLNDALARALSAYDKGTTQAVPTEEMAQRLGYKSANSGTALAAIASLRYYGLLERPEDGRLAVSAAVESYKSAPDEAHRRDLLIRFLRNPPVFDELLQRYKTALPSDTTIRHDLIHQGFLPGPAENCAAVFRKSVEFAAYFSAKGESETGDDRPPAAAPSDESERAVSRAVTPGAESHPGMAPRQPASAQAALATPASGASSVPGGPPVGAAVPAGDGDCIPVRLTGGRRAWLVIPQQFFEADKLRLKAQIDLLLTVEQEQALG